MNEIKKNCDLHTNQTKEPKSESVFKDQENFDLNNNSNMLENSNQNVFNNQKQLNDSTKSIEGYQV